MTDRIRKLTERYDKAAATVQALEEELARALLEAYRSGMTWAQVAEAGGLSGPSAARVRAERAMEPAEVSPSRRRRARETDGAEEAVPLGLSVAEAAARFGCSTATIYRRIDRGQLQSATDQLGRTRVLVD